LSEEHAINIISNEKSIIRFMVFRFFSNQTLKVTNSLMVPKSSLARIKATRGMKGRTGEAYPCLRRPKESLKKDKADSRIKLLKKRPEILKKDYFYDMRKW